MYAGDWILGLLGTTMWVGGVLSIGGAGAILFAVLHAAMGAGGVARARSIPPYGVVSRAAEVRARMRSRYMAPAWRANGAAGPAFDRTLANDGIGVFRPFPIRESITQPIAVLISQGAESSITRLPPLNESLRRRLATRVTEPSDPPARAPRRPRKARRKASRPSRKPVAA
ncbi:MAG TPA: hypothetical protein VGB34_06740 [Candidatus Limnocylindria bacterium]|jgi:hypothetical protein